MWVFILFQAIPACNKRSGILPLATADIAHLCSQLNYVFELLISMPQHFKRISISKIGLKCVYFLVKKMHNFRALGSVLLVPHCFRRLGEFIFK